MSSHVRGLSRALFPVGLLVKKYGVNMNVNKLFYIVWVGVLSLTGKPTGKRPLGRPRRRWEDNIRMDFEERYQCG